MKKLNLLQKKEGSTLVVAIIISAMLLTLGISAAKILVKDVQFSADLMLSEKAYFAAESGIEKSLLDLKESPVQHMENVEIDVDTNTKIILNLNNSVSSFDFSLPLNSSQKFRLLKDDKNTEEYNPVPIDTFNLKVEPAGHLFQWKILCKNKLELTKTISMVQQEVSDEFLDFFNHPDKNGILFSSWDLAKKETCFFSVQNLSNELLNFKFSNTSNMSPHKTHVHAIGKSGTREKHISFDYYQKNLGALFDFVLFHTDKGL